MIDNKVSVCSVGKVVITEVATFASHPLYIDRKTALTMIRSTRAASRLRLGARYYASHAPYGVLSEHLKRTPRTNSQHYYPPQGAHDLPKVSSMGDSIASIVRGRELWVQEKDKSDKPEKSDKPDKTDKTDKDKPEKQDKDKTDKPEKTKVSHTPSSTASTGAGEAAAPPSAPPSGSGSSSSSGGGSPPAKKKKSPAQTYPEILAVPISDRPLLPGFHRALVIRDPNVMKAIDEMITRGEPYLACFFLKEFSNADVIQDASEVHDIGVIAEIQIQSQDHKRSTVDASNEPVYVLILYPHKRVRLNSLKNPPSSGGAVSYASVSEDVAEDGELLLTSKDLEGYSEEFLEAREEAKKAKSGKTEDSKHDSKVTSKDGKETTEKYDSSTLQESPYSFLSTYDVSTAAISLIEDKPHDKNNRVITTLTNEILNVFKMLRAEDATLREQLSSVVGDILRTEPAVLQEPGRLADFAAALCAGEGKEIQAVLTALDLETRLNRALILLKREHTNAKLQQKIARDVENKLNSKHKKFLLTEQMKAIKKELGVDDGKEKLVEKFNERAEKLDMPENIQKVFEEEMTRLQSMEPSSSEYSVTRNYLDWITQIPWNKTTEDRFNLPQAKDVLDSEHYGMKEVKDRILEFIAVSRMKGGLTGKILLLQGPPGVGKTSIGKSIAKALNRQFYRFSVGGTNDASEVKGHRRTYVGAIPGRLVQALKQTQTENPLILIDEIDKLSSSRTQGDPGAALLEALDPEQNNAFLDHYLDVPIDLSKVLFVCTSNDLSTIPWPLLDRMEVIEMSGYVPDEKLNIANQYLVPQSKKETGLENVNVQVTDNAINALNRQYCRESGVRNLKKHIEKIFRKVVVKIVGEYGQDEVAAEKIIDVEPVEKDKESAEKKTTKSKSKKEVNEEPAAKEEKDKATESAESSETKVGTKAPPVTVPEDYSLTIDEKDLYDYVNSPPYSSDRMFEDPPPGVVMGLAYSPLGGSALYIECILDGGLSADSSARLSSTGNLGNVMKESTNIAYSFAKSFMIRNFPANRFFERAGIHLHCPAGAISKDGPSAGCAVVTGLLSLALNHAIDSSISMTGEISLTGKVMKIGGLREKAVGAHSAGAKTIIIPKDNSGDWDELPDTVKEGLTPVFAGTYQDVYDVVFQGLDTKVAAEVWKKQFDLIDRKLDKRGSK
ncbi:ATP-dependent Lon protease, putative [Yarrowia lipolytica]|nr:ATP-dependent Lon protease, putative [Yarrowia lipolytica]